MQKEHLHGDNWLETAKYPEITFEAKSLANVKTEGNVTHGGCHRHLHVARRLEGNHRADQADLSRGQVERARAELEGANLLVIRANFTINREEFQHPERPVSGQGLHDD